MECSLLNIGSLKADSWMSFWGGYLGAILGIIGAITVTTIQIKSQTNQIVVAAKENDKLERVRIELNLVIEKNIELYKYFIELRREQIKYRSALDFLMKEYSSLPDNRFNLSLSKIDLEVINKNSDMSDGQEEIKELESSIKEMENKIEKQSENITKFRDEIKQGTLAIKSLSSNILANLIFVNKDDEYFEILEKVINISNEEIKYAEKYILFDNIILFIDSDEFNVLNNDKSKYLSDTIDIEQECKEAYIKFMESLIQKIKN